jgi:hypothetical protein
VPRQIQRPAVFPEGRFWPHPSAPHTPDTAVERGEHGQQQGESDDRLDDDSGREPGETWPIVTRTFDATREIEGKQERKG